MELKITGRHIEISDIMRGHIEEKAEKLPRYNNSLEFVDVIVDGEAEGGNPSVEVIAKGGHNHIFVAKETSNGDQEFHALIDLVFHKVQRQLRKSKEKERNPIHSN